jgi:DNA-binding winged helix-turn-helix (wHTH) protein
VISPDRPASVMRFGEFTADLETGERHNNGTNVKLQGQPFEILALLLKHPGRIVTRDEVRRQLWPTDTFVDFEHGLNAAVNRLREALGDSAEEPRYIETVPRRGYRFITPIEGGHSVGRAEGRQARSFPGAFAASLRRYLDARQPGPVRIGFRRLRIFADPHADVKHQF